MIIFIAVILLAVVIGLLVSIITGMSKGKKRERNHMVAINKGVAVNEAATGSLGGGLLYGGESDCVTLMVGQSQILRAQGIVLIELLHLETQEFYEESMRDYLEIGRADTSGAGQEGLQLPFARISRKHCYIVRRDNVYYINDMGSTNHTYLNGNLVNGETPVKSGDALQLGSESFRIRILE